MTRTTDRATRTALITAAAAALERAEQAAQTGTRLPPEDAETGDQAVTRALDAGVTHSEILAARRA